MCRMTLSRDAAAPRRPRDHEGKQQVYFLYIILYLHAYTVGPGTKQV